MRGLVHHLQRRRGVPAAQKKNQSGKKDGSAHKVLFFSKRGQTTASRGTDNEKNTGFR
jgi:hypothetical protein